MLKNLCVRFFATEEPLILSSNHNYLCQVRLNKPKALNSLCVPMLKLLQEGVLEWDKDPSVRAVLFTGSGNKAFCAGGDIRSLYDAKQGGGDPSVLSKFFWDEYIVDYSIARMRAIQICFYDGIVMGGGVGISIHAPFRIATENAVFAMPETGIGLFPDVGGGYFLPRLQSKLGVYLGVSGARLVGEQLVQAGIATHFVPKERLGELKERLIEEIVPETSVSDVERLLASFVLPKAEPLSDIEEIEKGFSCVNSVEHIHYKLDEEKSEWAEKKLKSLEKLSPLSQKVVFQQLKRGKSLSLEEVFKMEYRLSQSFMNGTDFFEGVRAMLIEKDKNPQWEHKTVFEVPDEVVNGYFEKVHEDNSDLDVATELKRLRNI